MVNRDNCNVILCQEVADTVCGLWLTHPPFNPPPIHLMYSASFSNMRHHPLSGDLPPFCFPSLYFVSLFLSLNLSLPQGISFLSAFYSKSDRKALDTQPNLRDSGYIWFASYREMFYQRERWRASQTGKNAREEKEIAI